MLDDEVRCNIFREALFSRVQSGDVVLDVGAGTGILSIFAAQAGASRVYAVEATPIARFARELVDLNGFSDRIQVIEAPIEEVDPPEAVDVIVSEWLGGYGVDENLLPLVLLARNRWLKRSGIILPEQVTAWLAPVWQSWLQDEHKRWRSHRYGIDLTPISERLSNEAYYEQHEIRPEHLMAEPQVMWTTDVYTESIWKSRQPYEASLRFRATYDGLVNGLAAWFVAEFGDDLVLTTGPEAPKTHWGRVLLPLEEPLEVKEGTTISAALRCLPAGFGSSWAEWSVDVGNAKRRWYVDLSRSSSDT